MKRTYERDKIGADGNLVIGADGNPEKETIPEFLTNIYCKHDHAVSSSYKKLTSIGDDMSATLNRRMYEVVVKVYKDGETTPIITKTSSVIE